MTSPRITATTEITFNTTISATDLRKFVEVLPDTATVRAHYIPEAGQREPAQVTLKAVWEMESLEKVHGVSCQKSSHPHGNECARNCPTCHGFGPEDR